MFYGIDYMHYVRGKMWDVKENRNIKLHE